ncbi:MAG: DUF1501 domain-containing protein [Verrucomicrobiota bacterium]
MSLRSILESGDDLNRRDFVSYAARAFLGVGLLPHGVANALGEPSSHPFIPQARRVIYLYMAGGMTHLDTFDPKPQADENEIKGPLGVLPTKVDGMFLSEYLPGVAAHADKLAIIRSMTSTQGAHEQGNYFMHSSYVMRGTIKHPEMGAWLLAMDGKGNPDLPGFVRIGNSSQGGGAGFLDSAYEPLVLGNPNNGIKNSKLPKGVTDEDLDARLRMSSRFETEFHQRYDYRRVRGYSTMYDDALRLMRSRDLEAFDLSKESAELRDAYGRASFGQGCLLARRLVERDVRFVEVTLGGWDTHANNFDRVSSQTDTLDRAMATLLSDLERRGLLRDTMVVLSTEFGRTPRLNQNFGRDHYPKAFSCVLAGGGVKGGTIWGETDATGENILRDPVAVPDFNATIAYGLGLPLDKQLYSSSGRPFTVADKGQPVTQMFG